MNRQTNRRKRPVLLAAAAAVLALAWALVSPTVALADGPVAHSTDSSGNRVDYATVADVRNAAKKGGTIVMDADWDLGVDQIDVPGGVSLTIDMAGHKIDCSSAIGTINVYDRGSVKIIGSGEAKEMSYRGYAKTSGSTLKSQKWEWQDLTVKTQGLITNTDGGKSVGSGIVTGKGATVVLEGVTVAGCGYSGVRVFQGSSVTMTNTTVCHNWASKDGGGVYLAENSKLTMKDTHVDDNYSSDRAGGILADKNAKISMEGDCTVSGNTAATGGAVYINNYGVRLVSTDAKAVFANNACFRNGKTDYSTSKSGGAIHAIKSGNSTECVIEGITIKDNYSAFDAGGVQIDHEGATIRNCTITGNSCEYEGGGVNIYASDVTLENCTITGNVCNLSNKGYEGGGVFVGSNYDIKLSKVCLIKGNTRGENGSADDVMLRESAFSKAYIKGYLDKGSSVGVRTGTSGDRRIAKNFSCSSRDGLFMDLSDSYYVSYGSDDGGDAWQRHATRDFTLTVNGSSEKRRSGSYAYAYASAPNLQSGKRFWRWDASKATGLYPVTDYINGSNMYGQQLAFKMPQNDVSLTAAYVDTVKGAKITVQAPQAGQDLPAKATLTRTDGGEGASTATASVCWYEMVDGAAVPAAGKAKAGTTYYMVLAAQQSTENGLFFDGGISKGSVSVVLLGTDGEKTVGTVSAEVASFTGQLSVKSADFKTDGEKGDGSASTGKVKVQMKNAGLLNGSGEQAVAALADDGEAAADSNLLGSIDVTYDTDSQTVAIAAPYVKGYNFCNWEGVKEGWVRDDVDGVVEIPAADLASIDELTALYTPVATELTVGLDAPVAGADLVGGCTTLTATCSDGTVVNLADEFEMDDCFTVTWSPDDGTAVNSTTYTALIELGDATEGLTGVEDVLAADATVTCNNGAKATSASFMVVDGKLCLAVTFPATADESADPVDPDDSGKKDDDEKPGDETDDADSDTDKGDADADKSDESGKTDGTETNEDQVNGQTAAPAATAKKAKAGTPSTGDVTFTAAGALLAVAATCLAVAVFSRRSQH